MDTLAHTTRIELGRDNKGYAHISATEFDAEGYGVRTYMLSSNHDGTIHDDIMARRFWDMLRLMGDNVTHTVEHEFSEGSNPLYAVD